jgi:hypothetical protein
MLSRRLTDTLKALSEDALAGLEQHAELLLKDPRSRRARSSSRTFVHLVAAPSPPVRRPTDGEARPADSLRRPTRSRRQLETDVLAGLTRYGLFTPEEFELIQILRALDPIKRMAVYDTILRAGGPSHVPSGDALNGSAIVAPGAMSPGGAAWRTTAAHHVSIETDDGNPRCP